SWVRLRCRRKVGKNMTPHRVLGVSIRALALSAAAFSLPAAAATENIIYNLPFNSGPHGRLQEDRSGVLYGTASTLDRYGAAFRLAERGGVWNFKIIHNFDGSDGRNPNAGLLQDNTTGTIYGVTERGGTSGHGVVFSLTAAGKRWIDTTLHDFTGSQGSAPSAPLLQDKTTGVLYGTARLGGSDRCGTAFELNQSGGSWSYSLLHDFAG